MQFSRRLNTYFSRNLYSLHALNLEASQGIIISLGQSREFHVKMIDSILQPPSHVKGMTILDKNEFKKTITVPCLYLPLNSINDIRKVIKQYLLKLQNFRPMTLASKEFIEALKDKSVACSFESGKVAVLDPHKVQSYFDICESDRKVLETFGICEKFLSSIQMTLTYDNWKADEILRAVIPPEFESVSGYSLVGHIIHLNLREHLLEYKYLIGAVLLDKVKCARTVVNKVDIIDNTYRNFQMEILCGENNMIVKVKENKCAFEFDFSQVYWNPRLSTEHERITERIEKNSIVYDVFCGVGPFTIPAAKRGCIVLANDLNPQSIYWLKSNMKLNKVESRIEVFNKDGKDFITEDIKKHMLTLKPGCKSITILMNLPALAPTFLCSFLGLFSEVELEKIGLLPIPRIVVYCFVKGVCDANEVALHMISKELNLEIHPNDNELEEIFYVREVAQNKKMLRITLKLTKKILSNLKRSWEQISENEDSQTKKHCH